MFLLNVKCFGVSADFLLLISSPLTNALQWRYFILKRNVKLLSFEGSKQHFFRGILRARLLFLPIQKSSSFQSEGRQWNLYFFRELGAH